MVCGVFAGSTRSTPGPVPVVRSGHAGASANASIRTVQEPPASTMSIALGSPKTPRSSGKVPVNVPLAAPPSERTNSPSRSTTRAWKRPPVWVSVTVCRPSAGSWTGTIAGPLPWRSSPGRSPPVSPRPSRGGAVGTGNGTEPEALPRCEVVANSPVPPTTPPTSSTVSSAAPTPINHPRWYHGGGAGGGPPGGQGTATGGWYAGGAAGGPAVEPACGPVWTQNCHPAGAAGQPGSGVHPGGGCPRGGTGRSGGGLKVQLMSGRLRYRGARAGGPGYAGVAGRAAAVNRTLPVPGVAARSPQWLFARGRGGGSGRAARITPATARCCRLR